MQAPVPWGRPSEQWSGVPSAGWAPVPRSPRPPGLSPRRGGHLLQREEAARWISPSVGGSPGAQHGVLSVPPPPPPPAAHLAQWGAAERAVELRQSSLAERLRLGDRGSPAATRMGFAPPSPELARAIQEADSAAAEAAVQRAAAQHHAAEAAVMADALQREQAVQRESALQRDAESVAMYHSWQRELATLRLQLEEHQRRQEAQDGAWRGQVQALEGTVAALRADADRQATELSSVRAQLEERTAQTVRLEDRAHQVEHERAVARAAAEERQGLLDEAGRRAAAQGAELLRLGEELSLEQQRCRRHAQQAEQLAADSVPLQRFAALEAEEHALRLECNRLMRQLQELDDALRGQTAQLNREVAIRSQVEADAAGLHEQLQRASDRLTRQDRDLARVRRELLDWEEWAQGRGDRPRFDRRGDNDCRSSERELSDMREQLRAMDAIRAERDRLGEQLAAARGEASQQVAAARSEAAQQAAAAKAEGAQQLAAARAQGAEQLTAAKAQAQQQLAAARSEAAEQLSALREQLTAARSEAAQQLSAARAEGAQQLAALRAEAAEQLAEVKTEAAARAAAAQEQFAEQLQAARGEAALLRSQLKSADASTSPRHPRRVPDIQPTTLHLVQRSPRQLRQPREKPKEAEPEREPQPDPVEQLAARLHAAEYRLAHQGQEMAEMRIAHAEGARLMAERGEEVHMLRCRTAAAEGHAAALESELAGAHEQRAASLAAAAQQLSAAQAAQRRLAEAEGRLEVAQERLARSSAPSRPRRSRSRSRSSRRTMSPPRLLCAAEEHPAALVAPRRLCTAGREEGSAAPYRLPAPPSPPALPPQPSPAALEGAGRSPVRIRRAQSPVPDPRQLSPAQQQDLLRQLLQQMALPSPPLPVPPSRHVSPQQQQQQARHVSPSAHSEQISPRRPP
eukprot:TRINITY_DN2289_c0_g1_i1.p1 TRINITY_DN2289_c0_g1~~TRINITY_DN2289_c0_g1_i1.p1  ORF type:complete len:916 (+),score=343.84 TRINITY_DN2289_c0_g1_i1:81-2828(+)